ncbi:hypothetical protein C8Q73DRAFT_710156 [Cubamyces lactineus]|nr:hypothetical protein C8Q73DRAFT_710156 [Cubamyces lactineus]
MSFATATETEGCVPNIAITPALPSRASLPSEMRAILDSIVGPVVPSEPSLPAGPYTARDEPFRLELDLTHARFSVGQVAAALDAACRAVSDLETVGGVQDATSDISPARPCSVSAFNHHDVVLTDQDADEMSCCTGPGSLDGEDGHTQTGSSNPSCSRNGRVDPTWRHAIYFDSSVWPAAQDQSKPSERVRKDDSWPAATGAHFTLRFKSGWSRIKHLVRPFGRDKKGSSGLG